MQNKDQKWNSLDKIIVDLLCQSAEILVYDIHMKYHVSPASIAESMIRLQSVDLVQGDEDRIARGPDFFDKLLIHRQQIYQRPMPWKSN